MSALKLDVCGTSGASGSPSSASTHLLVIAARCLTSGNGYRASGKVMRLTILFDEIGRVGHLELQIVAALRSLRVLRILVV